MLIWNVKVFQKYSSCLCTMPSITPSISSDIPGAKNDSKLSHNIILSSPLEIRVPFPFSSSQKSGFMIGN